MGVSARVERVRLVFCANRWNNICLGPFLSRGFHSRLTFIPFRLLCVLECLCDDVQLGEPGRPWDVYFRDRKGPMTEVLVDVILYCKEGHLA